MHTGAPTTAEGSRGGRLLTDIGATAALVVSGVALAVALASLLFSDELGAGLPRATGTFLVTGGLIAAWIGWRASTEPVVAVTQDAPVVVLVAMVARLQEDGDALAVADVFVLLAIATVASGAAMYLLGLLGMGDAVRYLPTVVVNGFIAGTGWLLLVGGIDVMVMGDLAWSTLFDGDVAARWAPGLALGVVIWLISASDRIPQVAASGALVVATAVFAIAVALGSSFGAVQDDGWLVGPFDESTSVAAVTPSDLADADWSAFGSISADGLSLLIVTIVALLLNLSALEATTGKRIDTNRELRTTGSSNIAAGLIGSVPTFHGLGDSVLAMRIGVRGRAVPIAVGLVMVVFGLAGASLAGYVPAFIAGGLLVAVGLSLLDDWVRFVRSSIGWADRLVSATVVGVIAGVGILEGVIVGLILACAVFVVRYSRVDPIRRASTGATTRSRVDRSPADAEVLATAGTRTRVLELQGYLFFGSVTRLLETVRTSVADTPPETIIFDFRFVTGVDPVAMTVFLRAVRDYEEGGTTVWVSAAPMAVDGLPTAETLDVALARVEQEILDRTEPADTERREREMPWLAHFETERAAAGDLLLAEGDDGDRLLIMLSGTASAHITTAAGQRHRVRQFIAPAWIGEIGFLRDTARSADVEADSAVDYAWIDRTRFEALRTEHPEVVIALLDDIAIEIADRAASLTSSLTQLLD
ncbi:MAG: SulP family inorganic anion transporter [Actinomycetota bacterium]